MPEIRQPEDQKRDDKEACGEVGTSWRRSDSEPVFTAPCALPLGHEEGHDWAQHESAIYDEGYRAGREDVARRLLELIERYRDEYADGDALPRSGTWHALDELLERARVDQPRKPGVVNVD